MKKIKGNRITYLQQKLPSALSCQDELFSAMVNCFLYCTSCPEFEIFRSDPFIQMNHEIEGEKDTRVLTAPQLKTHANAEWNTFKKNYQKEAHDHHAEAKFNHFCQFINDGATLKNKEKCKYFGMKFAD